MMLTSADLQAKNDISYGGHFRRMKIVLMFNILCCELEALVSIWINIFDFLITLHVYANMVKSV